MRATGNGAPKVCAENLLKTFRGEVPFERVKGIDPRFIDKPSSETDADLQEDARWLIETFEPRAEFNGIALGDKNAVVGGFSIIADITEKEG